MPRVRISSAEDYIRNKEYYDSLSMRERMLALGLSGGQPSAAIARPRPELGTVERKPQTTASPSGGGPFVRHSREARLAGFDVTGQAFSGLVTQNLKPVGGYIEDLRLLVKASGGSGTTTNATAAADAPENVISSLILRDPFGQPIVQCDGVGLRLIDMYGGSAGFYYTQDPRNLPSFSNVATTGNFTERFIIPIEHLSDAYTALPSMNASAQPLLQINLAAAATVFTTSPSPTLPTIEVRVDETYWAAPIDDPSLAPPGVGSSHQWSQSNVAQTVASASAYNLTLPRVGTWIDTLILLARDSTGVRVDTVYPAVQGSPIEFWVDGTPYYSETIDLKFDAMTIAHGAGAVAPSDARPTGVLVYSWRDSAFKAVSDADTGDLWLHTTPGTLLEVRSTSQSIANAPATVTCYTGEVYPLGGIPYGHLAE